MQSLTTSLQNSRTLELSTDERVRMLQRKLYLKAKQSKTFKYYVLYDKISLDYFIQEAYRRVKASLHLKPRVYVKRLNIQLRGWVNYFKIKGVSHMYDSVSRVAGYLGETIYRMIRHKSQNGWSKRYRQFAYKKFIQKHGLINLYECIH